MTTSKWTGSLTVVALLIGLTGCGQTSGGDPPEADTAPSTPASSAPASPEAEAGSSAPAQEPAVITIKDFEYSGPESVAPGTQITVKNEDTVAHTVTSEDEAGFDVTIEPGASATFNAPSEAGSYPYICSFHPNMSGTLVVQ